MNLTFEQWFKQELDKFGSWYWNETGVDVILSNPHEHEDVQIKKMVDFFSTLDVPHLKSGNVVKMFESGVTTIEQFIKSSESRFVSVIGQNGKKIYEGLHHRLSNIEPYVLIGAFADARGIGVRKMKKLHQALGTEQLINCTNTSIIESQEGFDTKTANRVVMCLADFRDFYSKISNFVKFAEEKDNIGGSLAGQKVVMTGFRDKDLEQNIIAAGGEVQTAVSSKTTIVVAVDPNSNSGKLKKARDMGIRIVSVDQIREIIQ